MSKSGTNPKALPKQERSRKTYEKILTAAQGLLEASGIEAFNSNAIVERAGMTPPALYRWFPNKHAILRVLGERLMDAQSLIVQDVIKDMQEKRTPLIEGIAEIMERSIELTKEFGGGHTLLVAMRALPILQPVRVASHDNSARTVAAQLADYGYAKTPEETYIRCRLMVEFGYATIEMLFETGFENRKAIIAASAHSQVSILEM